MKTETLLEKIGKLFKNNLNREEIAKELGVSVEVIDKEVSFVFGTKVLQESFRIQDYIELLTMSISDFFTDYKEKRRITTICNRLRCFDEIDVHKDPMWKLLTMPEVYDASMHKRQYGGYTHKVFIGILYDTFGIKGPISLTEEQIKILKNYREFSS